MKLIHLIAAAFFLPLGLNAQVFFATPTNTQDNDIPVSAIELPDNRYAFAVYNKHGNMWFYSNSDVTLFLTDSVGGVIHQRTFKNNKARYLCPRQLFFQDNKIASS